jgi:hypothetical protein
VGVGATIATRPPPPAPVERIVYVDRAPPPAPSAPAAPVVLPSVSATTAAPITSVRTAGAAAAPPASSASSGDQLAAESALLDIARVAVARGEGDKALAAIERHRAQFPGGLLAEEREALTIKALHLQGRDPEARALLTRFERSYPGSLFLPALRGVVAK